MSAEAIVLGIAGAGGFIAWALAQARQLGRVEAKQTALVESLTRVDVTLASAVAEIARSREDQGRRIGALEGRVSALEAVDRDRSQAIRVRGDS
jgi:hypothetical protein